MDPLATSWSVVAPNNPGSAGTPTSPRRLVLDEVADRIAATATMAGLDRFPLVGQSLGCAIAVRLATRYPARVTRLVLIAGFARARATLRLNLDTWEGLLDADPHIRASFLTSISWPETYLNDLSADELRRLCAGAAVSEPGVRQHIRLARTADVTTDLSDVQAPTLVLSTTRDRFVSPDHSDDFAAGIPVAERVDIDGGHCMVAERPRELVHRINGFL